MQIGTFQIPQVRAKKEEFLQFILRLQNKRQSDATTYGLRKTSPVIKVVTRERSDKTNNS